MIKPEKVVEDLKKLVSTILGLYRKALFAVFWKQLALMSHVPLEPYVEDVLNALFPNACLDPDDSSVTLNPTAIKNHSEAFRCFHRHDLPTRIVYYLLHKIQSVVDMQKLGAINVLRHLLNSAGQYMEDKRSLLMMGLRKLLAAENNSSIRVKRAIVQLCVALSDHAYVDAEGGALTAFLDESRTTIRAGGSQARKVEVDVAGLNQLRTQCGQALHTIASTCVCANKLLWPYLFEFICTERYFPVVGDICKCLRTLVTRELQEGRELDFETGFDNARVAGNHAVLARLFVCLCNAPLNGLLARRARELWFDARARLVVPSVDDRCVLEKWSDRMESLMDEVCSTSLPSPSGECSPAVELRGRRIA
ncbi:hypothetical protein OSTOST_24522, partial [Ostertagia ostertagi]